MKQVIAVSDAQKEFLEMACSAVVSEPIERGEIKTIKLDCSPYTPVQLRGLFRQIINSTAASQQILVVSDTQKEILEKVVFAFMNQPMQGAYKTIQFDCSPYTQTQLRDLFKQVNNSMSMPR